MTSLRSNLVSPFVGRGVLASLAGLLGGTLGLQGVASAQQCVVRAQVYAAANTGLSGGTDEAILNTGDLTIAPASVDSGGVGPASLGGHVGAQVQYGASADFGTLAVAMNCYADTGDPFEAGAYSMAASNPGAAPNARSFDRLTVSHATASTIQVKLSHQLIGSVSLSSTPLPADNPTGAAQLIYGTVNGTFTLRDLPVVNGDATDAAEAIVEVPNGGYIDLEHTLYLKVVCNTGAIIQPFRQTGLAEQTATMAVEILTPGAVGTLCSGATYVGSDADPDGGVSSAPTSAFSEPITTETSETSAASAWSETSSSSWSTPASSQSAPSTDLASSADTSTPPIGSLDTDSLDAGGLDAGDASAALPTTEDPDAALGSTTGPGFAITVETVGSDTSHHSATSDTNRPATTESQNSAESSTIDASVPDAGTGPADPEANCECRTARTTTAPSATALLPLLGALVWLGRRRRPCGSASPLGLTQ